LQLENAENLNGKNELLLFNSAHEFPVLYLCFFHALEILIIFMLERIAIVRNAGIRNNAGKLRYLKHN
jgi:hypothetical protein